MKYFIALLVSLVSVHAHATTVHCQAGDHSLYAKITTPAGSEGHIEYVVNGPTYHWEGFVMNDPTVEYKQNAYVKYGETVDLEADLTKTEVSDFPVCIKPIPGTRACEEYSSGPHPMTTLSQSFFLRMRPAADGMYTIGYFSIYGANPDLAGSYHFEGLKDATCTLLP